MVLLPDPDTPITISTQGILSESSPTKILRQRRLIHEPDRLVHGVRTAGRQVLAIEHARQDRALVRARDFEQHFAAGVERRPRQRPPRPERLDARPGGAPHPPLGALGGPSI